MFCAEVVWVKKLGAVGLNADNNARWALRRSLALWNGPILNRAFRLGTRYLTTSFKFIVP